MLGHAGSPIGIVHANMILTWLKVKDTGLLNFWKLPKPCVLAGWPSAPLRFFLVYYGPSTLQLRCHTFIRTSTKSFQFWSNLVCVCRPWPHMRTSVTSTWSKVKVKVMELPKLRKLHFSRSISSAVLAWSSKLMIGSDSMRPGLQLVWAWFSNFLLGKLSWQFRLRWMSIFHEIQMAIFQ